MNDDGGDEAGRSARGARVDCEEFTGAMWTTSQFSVKAPLVKEGFGFFTELSLSSDRPCEPFCLPAGRPRPGSSSSSLSNAGAKKWMFLKISNDFDRRLYDDRGTVTTDEGVNETVEVIEEGRERVCGRVERCTGA